VSYAHEFFFAFAEVEYNEVNGRFEVSITATTHDLDKQLRAVDAQFKGLQQASGDSLSYALVESELNKHFSFSFLQENSIMDGTNAFYFQLDGIETQLNGTVVLYLSAASRTVNDKMEVTFDLLMEQFPEQQNKLTFIYRGKKSTLVFLPNQRTQLIELTKS
jgi:hypothetical protein